MKCPEELKEIRSRFDARAAGFRLTTNGYQLSQRRHLVFLLQPQISHTFLQEIGLRPPSKSISRLAVGSAATPSTYWVAITTAAKALNIQIPDAAKVTRWLKSIAEVHPPPRQTITLQQLQQDVAESPQHIKDSMILAFLLGARYGDILQLEQRSISLVGQHHLKEPFVAITFYAGKTVGICGVYAVNVSSKGEAYNILKRAQLRGWKNLFTPPGSRLEEVRTQAHMLIGDVRALRRGGLQMMAHMGVPPETILHFSKHRTIEMLYKYLHFGADLTHQANQTASVVSSMEKGLFLTPGPGA